MNREQVPKSEGRPKTEFGRRGAWLRWVAPDCTELHRIAPNCSIAGWGEGDMKSEGRTRSRSQIKVDQG
jgi:hypothetical protein